MTSGATGLFVTGTDTGVGKTIVSVAFARALRVRGRTVGVMKPIASGCIETAQGLRSEDALRLIEEQSVSAPYELVNPFAFGPAIAPHLAAATAGVPIELARIRTAFARLREPVEVMIVEGAGGFCVPLGKHLLMEDLVADLGLPVVLVVGLRLGCLNHALLTARAILARGIPFAGWVGSLLDPHFAPLDGNLATLTERLPAPCLGILPHLDTLDIDRAASALLLERLPAALTQRLEGAAGVVRSGGARAGLS